MPKRKTQKVRFQKGDKRPGGMTGTLSYVKKMKKKKKDIIWQVIEKPTNNVVAEFFFEEVQDLEVSSSSSYSKISLSGLVAGDKETRESVLSRLTLSFA